MVDNGYDVADFYKINPLYGTMEDMDSLIAEANRHHIKIVMDLVFNHTSDQNEWFLESKKSKDNPKSDWYIWRDAKPDGSAPNNWRGIFGGSAWEWNEERKQYYLHTFATAQPDLNWANPDVRQALYDITNFWINKGVGGFRIDAIPYIKKPAEMADGTPDAADSMVSIHDMTANTDGILDYLYEFKQKTVAGKGVFTVAEANGVGPEQLKFWVGDSGAFDMLFEFSHLPGADIWHKAKKISIPEVKSALISSQVATASNGWYPVFFENHDKPRSVNAYFSEKADRILAAKAMGTLMLTLRGTPFIYEGQELGMSNVHWNSVEVYNDVNTKPQYNLALQEGYSPKQAISFVQAFSRDNARTPMQWDTSANAGFTTGKPWLALNENFKTVNALSETTDSTSVLNWYRKLAQIRKQQKALTQGTFTPILADHAQIFAYKRIFAGGSESDTVTVLVNLSEMEATYDSTIVAGCKLIISNYDGTEPGKMRPLEAVLFAN
jgi:alpha-glucosidase